MCERLVCGVIDILLVNLKTPITTNFVQYHGSTISYLNTTDILTRIYLSVQLVIYCVQLLNK